MVGLISYCAEKRPLRVYRGTVASVPFAVARLSQRSAAGEYLAAVRAAAQLRRLGVKEAVFPTDYPHMACFKKKGIFPVDPLPLYRKMAPELIKRKMEQKSIVATDAAVAVVTQRLNRETEQIVLETAQYVRHVMLSVSGDAEEFGVFLRREYGISLIVRPSRQQLEQAEVLLFLCAAEWQQARNPIALHFYGGEWRNCGVRFALPRQLQGEVEENCDQLQLLTVLCRQGMLKNYQIDIIDVDSREKSYYNASTVII